jgi:hypothetical protein
MACYSFSLSLEVFKMNSGMMPHGVQIPYSLQLLVKSGLSALIHQVHTKQQENLKTSILFCIPVRNILKIDEHTKRSGGYW